MKLIREFTEFNNMRMGSDSVPQSTHVDDPNLSYDGFDRFEANLKNSLHKLNDLYKDISQSTTGVNLRSGETIDSSDIKKIKILRIYPKDDIYMNVYFTFEIDDEEYYGVINKINSPNSSVSSEIFRDRLVHGSKEWVIRIKGNISKAINQWLSPISMDYLTLKELDVIDEITGELLLIPSDTKIKLIRVMGGDEMLILYNDRNYILSGNNFFYFNYFLSPIEEEKEGGL